LAPPPKVIGTVICVAVTVAAPSVTRVLPG